jgi:Predicted Permease Membrane Region
MSWLTATLRSYPEIALFLSLGIGYWVGGKSYRGFSLGAVTATLLAAIAIGQLGITVSSNVKSVFFLMFLFAVGYSVGPQFVRGIAKDGLPQAIFSVIQCLLCLAAPYIAAKIAGYSVGSAAGLFAGSQTISASMGLATDAINRLGLPPDEAKRLLDAMPTAYAVTYIFGTIGSALILATLGPKLLGIDLVAACKEYEEKFGGEHELGGLNQAWHQYELRAYRIAEQGPVVGMTVAQAEAASPAGMRLYIERIRRDGVVQDAKIDAITRKPFTIFEPLVQNPEQACRLLRVALDGEGDLFRGAQEEDQLSRHRTESGYLPEQPLHRVHPGTRVLRHQLARLLDEIEEDGAGLEHADGRSAADRIMVDDRRHLVVGCDPQKVFLELLVLLEIDRHHPIGKPGFLQVHRDLVTVGCGPVMQIDHRRLREWLCKKSAISFR